ncbi:serine/threonine protein kinase [Microbacterium sp. B35-04]|uniref:serine/threonine-protein kinase n=1 Tax=Microbacterium sp. B35-04 TaxID=1961716 RepID=UPI0013D193A4|nr:serine/threonine-protein kinase [Microbacterium sp. B35-04]KAF2413972.1 serine/threonine protein kinase [Microbacterium sp. B35-04]
MTTDDSQEAAALLDGRYRLGECVGEGGMARVYRAEDVVLGRTVAIKLIRPGVDGASSERARSEMTVLASLNHPSLVTLFDARLVPGQPEYLVMEFVDGPTLSSRLAAGGPLRPDAVAHLGAELAEALHVVHQAGVVHRDIKPSNVLLSPAQLPGSRPRAKLADFGIAYLLDASRLTSPGLVVGTVAYLAPEQIRGGEPAPASDIYSLGLVLLEALTGERAHPHGGGMAAAVARVENPPAIPPMLHSRWRDLLMRMMDAEPQSRPTAAEVAAAAGTLTDPAGAVAVPAPATDVTVPLTAATLVAPAAGVLAGGAPATAGAPPPPAAPAENGTPVRGGRPARLMAMIGGALAAVAVGIAVVIGATVPGGRQDTPAPVPAVTDPSDSPPPADDTGNDTVVDDPGMTKEERKAAEEARKEAEEAQKKLEEEQRKQAEEEQKRLEDQQKQGDDEQGDEQGDD